MPSYQMEVHWASCSENGHLFEVHSLAIDYGTLLARTSEPAVMAVVDALDDTVFLEGDQITTDLMASRRTKVDRIVDCFNRIFGFACDPAPSGERYALAYIDDIVRCPICQSPTSGYGPKSPRQFVDMQLSSVTHDEWNRMSLSDKKSFIAAKLRLFGCIL